MPLCKIRTTKPDGRYLWFYSSDGPPPAAGFGGCTVNLVRQNAGGAFEERVVERYRRETGLPAKMYCCAVVDGLRLHRME